MAEPARKIYDDEQEGTSSSAYGRAQKKWGMETKKPTPQEEGASSPSARERANQAWGMTPGELAEAERNPKPSAPDDSGELSHHDDTIGKGYSTENSGRFRAALKSRRTKIGAGVATASVAGFVAFSSFLGPNLLINHLRELLLTRISQVQVDHSLKYRRRYIHRVGDLFSRDGRRGGKIIAEMETRGYRFAFDNTGKMVGITPPGAVASVSGLGVEAHLADYLEVRHPLRTARWKTKRMEAFYNRYKVSRTPVTTRAPDDPDNPEEAVNGKVASDIFGDDVSTQTTPRGAGEGETESEAAAREASNAEHAAITTDSGVYEGIKEKLRNGTPLSELTPDERSALAITSNIDEELLEMLQRASAGSLAGRTFAKITSLFNVADVGDKICTVRNRLHGIQVAARTFRAVSMLRYASSFIKVGDAVRTSGRAGSVDPGMLNAVMKRVTATDRNGNALGASPGMAYILKGKFSRSANDAFKGNFGVDGKLVGFPGAVDSATKDLPGINRGSCSVIQNPVFQVGLGVVSIGIGVFTGGSSTAATEGVKQGFAQSLKAGIQSMLTKRVAASLLTGVAIDMSFEAAMMLTQFYAEKSMSLPFTGQEVGGELGDALAGGAGTLNKQRSLQAGMVPATSEQYAQTYTTYLAEKKEQQARQSLFARYFDSENADSLAFQTTTELALASSGALNSPLSNAGNLSSLASSFMSTPARSLSHVAELLTGHTYAQSNPDEISFDTLEAGGETLATDPAGNLLPIMRSDIENIDPDENIAYLSGQGEIGPAPEYEPVGQRFMDHLENCVYSTDTLTAIESNEFDCLAKEDLTKRFKAHLAFLDMLDTIDGGLFPEEITAQPSQPASDASGPIKGNTASTPCAPGTGDLGTAFGGADGNKYEIRLCSIPNFTSVLDPGGFVRVNSVVSGSWLELFTKASQAGFSLTASNSFRSYEEQEYFWNCYQTGSCNNGNEAARPGTSNHEMGFAVDIDITPGKDPSLTSCRANPAAYPLYQWLAANAPPLGINAGVNSECWHWSSGG